MTERKTFYKAHGIPLEEDERKRPNNSDFADADSGSNYDEVSGNVCNHNDAGSCGSNDQVCDGGAYGHDERQVERGHDNFSNERQGNSQGQPRMKKVYMPKVKASSNAETEVEEKPESASVTEEKVANTDNAVAAPASESDKSAG